MQCRRIWGIGGGASLTLAGCLASNPDWGGEDTAGSTATSEGTQSSGPTTGDTTSSTGTSSASGSTTAGPTTDPTVDPTASGTTSASGGSSGGQDNAYAMAVLSDDPLGYWRLGEDAGPTATDATGTQDATYLGAVELGHPGLVAGSDTSVYFPGSGMAYIRVGDTAGFAGRVPFSVEAWVLPDSDDAGCIMGKSTFTTTHEGWFAASHMSMVRFQRMNDGYFSAGHPEVGKVFHLVVTYDGSTEKMFIDGDLVGSRIHEVDVPANTDFLLIGDCANWGNFAGFIDEVAVYDHALTPDQISAHFNAGK